MKQPLLRVILSALALLALSRPTLCQGLNMQDMSALLHGSLTPLAHKLSDLDGTWRRVSTSASADGGNPAQAYLSLFSGGDTGNVYYTQGRTVTVGEETYLVAYHRQTPPFDFVALMRSGNNASPPKPTPLTPDTVLSLSLLNLRTAGSLNDIRPFDMQQEMTSSRQATAQSDPLNVAVPSRSVQTLAVDTQGASQTSVSNLKQLGLGLIQYVQDNDENLPPMKDAATMKKAILPYAKSEKIFIQPDTKRPYKPNTSLSKRNLASFNDPATMVVLYEDAPDQDNTRAVAFMDGHVKRIPESQWPSLKQTSHVPGP